MTEPEESPTRYMLHVTGSGDRWRRGRSFSEWSLAGQVSHIQQEEKEVQQEKEEEQETQKGIR